MYLFQVHMEWLYQCVEAYTSHIHNVQIKQMDQWLSLLLNISFARLL